MIDMYFMDDIRKSVDKKCKKLYKKGFFDRSWKKQSDEVMSRGVTEIYEFLR